jgi:hypothetical protein
MNRPVHFEIQADDPARCAKFYTDVFGWFIEQWAGQEYWLCYTNGKKTGDPSEGGAGINGGILPRNRKLMADAGINAAVITVEVAHYDEAATKILAAGGTEAMPKFALPGMAWQGYYLDTEGNMFGLHQADPNAK